MLYLYINQEPVVFPSYQVHIKSYTMLTPGTGEKEAEGYRL